MYDSNNRSNVGGEKIKRIDQKINYCPLIEFKIEKTNLSAQVKR